MNKENTSIILLFHATNNSKEYLSQIIKNNLENIDLISNEKIKLLQLKNPNLLLLNR